MMKNLSHGFSTLLISDAAADAVLDYWLVLLARGTGDVVAGPTCDLSGVPCDARLLLAPGIGLLVEDAPNDVLEPSDEAFVKDLELRSVAVQQERFRGH